MIPKSFAICSSVVPSGRFLATFTTSSRNSCGYGLGMVTSFQAHPSGKPDQMSPRRAAVPTVLDDMMQVTMPVKPSLCFVDADWPLGSKPFQLHEVWVVWPKRIIEMILEPGPLTPVVIDYLAAEISLKLPAAD